jgi:hypothetical protein
LVTKQQVDFGNAGCPICHYVRESSDESKLLSGLNDAIDDHRLRGDDQCVGRQLDGASALWTTPSEGRCSKRLRHPDDTSGIRVHVDATGDRHILRTDKSAAEI